MPEKRNSSFPKRGQRGTMGRKLLLSLIALFTVSCASATYERGFRHYHPEDVKAAVKQLLPLAEAGNADAQFNLGSLYYQGLGVPQDYREAVKWFRKAAEQGHLYAQVNLGSIYAEGIKGVIERDYPQALMWYLFAAARGDMEAIEMRDNLAMRMTPAQITEAQRLAREFRPTDAYTKLIEELSKQAQKGDGDAQFRLGLIYYYGRGITQDFTEALKWFKKAAEGGNIYAQHNVGYMYEKGEGAPQDYVEAAKWYLMAAERGNSQAQYVLGMFYEKGLGVPQDDVQALMWYNLSAARGDTRAKAARDRITVWMTPAQVAEAQRLAREFKGPTK